MKANKIRCLATAGPTREFFDPVRFLSNPSSGKMGFALARSAAALGWAVELISGPVTLSPPAGVSLTRVVGGEEMFREVRKRFEDCDIFIMAAAVMDYRPATYSELKLKKKNAALELELAPVVDILKTMAARKENQLVVGFAAETDEVESHAREKLKNKNLDFIVANRVGETGTGFESDLNCVSLMGADGSILRLGPERKTEIANELIARFARSLEKRGSGRT